MRKLELTHRSALLLALVSVLTFQHAGAQLPQNRLQDGQDLPKRVPVATLPASTLDFTRNQDNTGNVSLPIPLVTLGRVSLQLSYSNKDIPHDVRTENRYSPSGVVGLGWRLEYGSISGEINGTADTTDDRYFYNGPDGSYQIQQGADGVFRIPDYRPWMVERVMEGGNHVGGWRITKEDGTVLTFGEYNTSTKHFSLTFDSSSATRFFIGYNGLVSNPDASHYDSYLEQIPYQWDLSRVQEVSGNLTMVTYKQIGLPLTTGAASSGSYGKYYTRESHPYRVFDNRGNEVILVYGAMNATEYYNDYTSCNQYLVDTLKLNSIQIKRNGQISRQIGFTYSSPTDVLSIGTAKRYLLGFSFQDNNGNSLPSYRFDYYLASSDQFPGFLKSVTSPDGGTVAYSYQTQQLSNIQLSTKLNASWAGYAGGLAGKDFVALTTSSRSPDFIVYRQGPTGWYLDTSFPYPNNTYAQAASDYIVVVSSGTMFAVKQTESGWTAYNVDSTILAHGGTIGNMGSWIIGLGNNYFVVKHNGQGDVNTVATWDVSIVSFGPTGLSVVPVAGRSQEGGRFCDGSAIDPYSGWSNYVDMRAFCGEGYVVVASATSNKNQRVFSHFRATTSASWQSLGATVTPQFFGAFDLNKRCPDRVQIGRNFVAVVSYVDLMSKSAINVYRRDGLGTTLDLVDSTFLDLGSTHHVALSDDFYAYTYTMGEREWPGDRIKIRMWDNASHGFTSSLDTTFYGLFNRPVAGLAPMSITGLGNRLIVACKPWGDGEYVGVISYSPRQRTWSIPGQILRYWSNPGTDREILTSTLDQTTLIDVSFIPESVSWDPNTVVVHAYRLIGNSFSCTTIDSFQTHHYHPSEWAWQAGGKFFAFLTQYGQSLGYNDSLCTYTLNDLPNGELRFSGNPTNIVVRMKTYTSGMGDSSHHRFSFVNGVVNKYFTSEFGCVTDTLPGNNGAATKMYYTCKDSVVGSINYRDLAGLMYDEKKGNAQSTVVEEVVNTWRPVPVDPTNGVFFRCLDAQSTTTDGVSRGSTYSYGDFAHAFQLSRVSENGIDGVQRVTRIKYALDYSNTSSTSADPVVRVLDSMKTVYHILNAPVEKWVFKKLGSDSSSVLSAELTKYKSFAPGQILPQQILKVGGASQPAHFDPSTSTQTAFSCDTNYVSQFTFDAYTAFGDPIQQTDANGIPSTTTWGYGSVIPIGVIKNATSSNVLISVFDDGDQSGWTRPNGNWIIENGIYKQIDASDTAPWYTPNSFGGVLIDDATLESDVRFDNAGTYRYLGIMKYVDGNNYVRFELRKWEGVIWIEAKKDGEPVFSSSVSFTCSENRWYHLKGEIQGSTARLYVDGALIATLTSSKVDLSAGYIGLCTFATVASFDNVRYYPTSAIALSQSFDPISLNQIQQLDANGGLVRYGFDAFNRKIEESVRSGGMLRMANENRYTYSRRLDGNFSKTRPNAIESIHPPDALGSSDFTSPSGWTYSGDITFNTLMAGETTVRMGTLSGGWDYLSKAAPAGHCLARVDFYPDNSTGGAPHVIAFDGSNYRFCVQYDPVFNAFRIQLSMNGVYSYPLYFELSAPRNQWYTVEIEKTETGECYAFVFPRGEARIYQTGYMFTSGGYPTNWSPVVISWTNDDYYYLANHYVGLPDRDVVFSDGLGRQIQEQKQLKVKTIVVSNTMYDSLDRVFRAYKPYEIDFTGSNRHRYDSTFAANSDSYYNSMDVADSYTNGYPYSEAKYYSDPLGRVQMKSAPGTPWRMGSGKELKNQYLANGSYDVPGYSSSQLNKTRHWDEDSLATDNYVDNFGNTVARTVDPTGGLNLTTLFKYDILGNLTQSITPRGDTSTYIYAPLSRLAQKSSPDQGTTRYLYDKIGNLRLVKDAAHTGTTANSVNLTPPGGYIACPNTASGQFTLGMRGRVMITTEVYDIDSDEFLTIRIKANGVVVCTISSSGWSGSSNAVILPKGTYTYEIQTYGYYGYFGYSVVCNTGFEFVYSKYDAFSRLLEIGEYESSSTSSNFTRANAETTTFPTGTRLVTSLFTYDTPTPEALAAGQRNLKGRVSSAVSYRQGVPELYSYYSYDELGNTEWVLHKNSAGQWWQIKEEHDLQGRVTKKHFVDGTFSANNLYTAYTYDQAGRLTKVTTGPTLAKIDSVQEALYTYYATGTVKRKQLGVSQGVDYRYNSRDWMKQINQPDPALGSDPGGDGPNGVYADVFAMTLGHNNLVGIGTTQNAAPHWNGNISWTMYNMNGVPFNGSSLVGNTYTYDRAGRITGSNFGYKSGANWQGTTAYDDTGYTYDGNGNFQALHRFGNNGNPMDNLTYVYAGGMNRLRHVNDSVSADAFASDIDNQQTDNYAYDDNGSLQQDVQRDIAFVVNDIHNLPISEWKISTGAEQRYYYDTRGKRIRKDASITEYYVNAPDGSTEAVVKSDISQATYNIWANDNIGQVKRSASSWTRYYYLKDHLGTVKMTVNGAGTVVGWDDFYPFGMVMEGRSGASGSDPRYKYTTKERDAESGLDYFSARYYDARVGRFLSLDPLAEKFAQWNPYTYCFDNPENFIDPNGKESQYTIGGVKFENTMLEQLGLIDAMKDYEISTQGKANTNQSTNTRGNAAPEQHGSRQGRVEKLTRYKSMLYPSAIAHTSPMVNGRPQQGNEALSAQPAIPAVIAFRTAVAVNLYQGNGGRRIAEIILYAFTNHPGSVGYWGSSVSLGPDEGISFGTHPLESPSGVGYFGHSEGLMQFTLVGTTSFQIPTRSDMFVLDANVRASLNTGAGNLPFLEFTDSWNILP